MGTSHEPPWNPEHLEIVRRGADALREFRQQAQGPLLLRDTNLRDACLGGAEMRKADLRGADLRRANLTAANLCDAKLSCANLGEANLTEINLSGADLSAANLSGANLCNANFRDACLRGALFVRAAFRGTSFIGASLREAHLRGATLVSAALRGADLSGANLSEANLNNADLRKANLTEANLRDAKLCGADLREANLSEVSLSRADLGDAILRYADLRRAVLIDANLVGADLQHASLSDAVLRAGTLVGAKLDRAKFGGTTIESDLSRATGLERAEHVAPSSIAHELLLRPPGRPWPIAFLRGCGLSDFEIEHSKAIATNPIDFFSAFISYSSKDDRFAVKLHDALQAKGIRCWLDKHEILPGDNLTKRINEGIRLWDKVLLCCSRNSMTPSTGWWVTDEIRRALQKERQLQKERNTETLAVIPLNLDGFLFDSECTHEHAPTLIERHAAKFIGWDTDEKVFDEQLARVVKALRADDLARPSPPPQKL